MTWIIDKHGRYFGYMEFVDVLRRLETGWRRGESDFRIDVTGFHVFYPDGMCPLIATLRHLQAHGRRVHLELPRSTEMYRYWEIAGWIPALEGEPAPAARPGSTYLPMSGYRNGVELNDLVDTSLRIVAESGAFPTGVLTAFEWSLNEIADNVLVHADSDDGGWMQLNRFPEKNHVEFVVADTGRGIRASLAESYPTLTSDIDAIDLAVQKGTTRNRDIGQGNGLSGAARIATSSNGWLNLHSGSGQLRLLQGDAHQATVATLTGTVVTVTLPTDRPIDLSEALWGHVPTPAFELEYVGDHGIEFRVAEHASNFGNRETGARLRNRLLNVMTESPEEPVVIDFDGIDLVSASFADEFVAKLVREMGPMRFFGRIKLRNVTGFISDTLDRVISQRLADE
ncbi:MAG: DUF4325 domain-containing protein [Actinomycetota bacterium]|nr:DUF4325 domain-containing protein [Actinomycetota bacterium]